MTRTPITTRLMSAAFATVLTLAMFGGVNTLAATDVPAGLLARAAVATPG